MKALLLTLSLTLLGACAAPPMYAGPAPAPPMGSPEADQCGAAAHQWLVGRGHREIPPQPAGATWRVYASGDPVTMDYSPQRMNIEYHPQTHRIVRVRCG